MTIAVAEATVYRSKGPAAIIFAAGVIGGTAFAIGSWIAQYKGRSASAALPDRLVFVAIGVLLVACSLRLVYCKVLTHASGVTVVNPLSRRNYDSDAIDRFQLEQWGPLPRNLVIHLRDGRRVCVCAVGARNPTFVRHDRAAEWIERELNALLGARRQNG